MKKKTTADYLPAKWKDTAWSMAREGASTCEILRELVGSNHATWHRIKQDPDVQAHLQRCREVAEAWWLRHGQQILMQPTKYYPVHMYMVQMRMRFGYTFAGINSDQQATVTGDGQGKINVQISVVQPDNSKIEGK